MNNFNIEEVFLDIHELFTPETPITKPMVKAVKPQIVSQFINIYEQSSSYVSSKPCAEGDYGEF